MRIPFQQVSNATDDVGRATVRLDDVCQRSAYFVQIRRRMEQQHANGFAVYRDRRQGLSEFVCDSRCGCPHTDETISLSAILYRSGIREPRIQCCSLRKQHRKNCTASNKGITASEIECEGVSNNAEQDRQHDIR